MKHTNLYLIALIIAATMFAASCGGGGGSTTVADEPGSSEEEGGTLGGGPIIEEEEEVADLIAPATYHGIKAFISKAIPSLVEMAGAPIASGSVSVAKELGAPCKGDPISIDKGVFTATGTCAFYPIEGDLYIQGEMTFNDLPDATGAFTISGSSVFDFGMSPDQSTVAEDDYRIALRFKAPQAIVITSSTGVYLLNQHDVSATVVFDDIMNNVLDIDLAYDLFMVRSAGYTYDCRGDTEGAIEDWTCTAINYEVCDNGLEDGGINGGDCLDIDCFYDASCERMGPLCSDGIDNDGDGKTDCMDIDCTMASIYDLELWNYGFGCAPGMPIHDCVCDEICDDDIDNDGDGKKDCDDLLCAWDEACTDCNSNGPRCFAGDQIQEGSGYTCAMYNTVLYLGEALPYECRTNKATGASCCVPPHEGGKHGAMGGVCSNGMDDDFDGKADCDDDDCASEEVCL